MKIGGLQKTTLLDYPHKVAAIVFTQGCNFRCSFCYNGELVIPDKFSSPIPEKDIFGFLKKRKNVLDGIVITGGEPTLHKDLPEFIKKIKDLGLSVKLDTNGTNPEMVKGLLVDNLIDYIAMDIKAPLDRYEEVVGRPLQTEDITKSIEIIMDSDLDYEFRSTLVPDIHTLEDIKKMGKMIEGAKKWYLQKFMYLSTVLDHGFKGKIVTDLEMEEFLVVARGFVDSCEIRW